VIQICCIWLLTQTQAGAVPGREALPSVARRTLVIDVSYRIDVSVPARLPIYVSVSLSFGPPEHSAAQAIRYVSAVPSTSLGFNPLRPLLPCDLRHAIDFAPTCPPRYQKSWSCRVRVSVCLLFITRIDHENKCVRHAVVRLVAYCVALSLVLVLGKHNVE